MSVHGAAICRRDVLRESGQRRIRIHGLTAAYLVHGPPGTRALVRISRWHSALRAPARARRPGRSHGGIALVSTRSRRFEDDGVGPNLLKGWRHHRMTDSHCFGVDLCRGLYRCRRRARFGHRDRGSCGLGSRGRPRRCVRHLNVGRGDDGLGGSLRLCRRLHRRHWSSDDWTDRQQAERIHVALRIARDPNAEVDVRLRATLRADGPHDRPLADERAALDTDRAEVEQRRRVAEGRLNRDRPASGRDRARKRHHALSGSEDPGASGRAQINSPMLAARIGLRAIEDEGSQDGAVNRPAPGSGNGDRQRKCAHGHEGESPHRYLLCCQFCELGDGSKTGTSLSILATKYGDRARCATSPSAG
jgi:hypothetical protein